MLFSCFSLVLLIAGCGGSAPANAGATAPTVTITASPASITAGASSTLTVTATNATSVTVTGTNGSSHTLPAGGGTISVTPTQTTTFTATATGAGGMTSATATVTIGSSGTAPTVSILANPTSVATGGASTLTVTAFDATSVTVTGTDGSSYNLQATGGTQVVNPKVTTTYTATATCAAGTATCTAGTATATAVVTVVAPVTPTVTITASPTSISAGSSSTLTVVATNATAVTVTGTDGSSYPLQPSGGTPSVSPTVTTTYTATATGPGGKVTASTTVTVAANPAPTVAIIANPTSVTAGSSSLLTVTAMNATTVTISGTDGSTYTLQATGGKQAVSPATTTTYTATATGPGGTITATATLTVTPNPVPTVTMTASPSSVVSGTSSILAVTTTNATSVTITGTDGSSYTLPSTSGPQTVTPTATTTYTATATGPGGTTTATATVTVTPNPAPTVTIAANPTSIVAGGSSTLTVVATNATAVTITGTDGSTYNLPTAGGTQAVTPTATTTYTATATGTLGKATSASTTVAIVGTGVDEIDHVVFMMQENHSFDNYFGMINLYRVANGYNVGANGTTYTVDGIDDKLATISNTNDEGTVFPLFKFKSTCVDDMSSAWLESYGDANTYNFATGRPILMDGFVHNAEGFAKSCVASNTCSGKFSDTVGQRPMGYYDQGFLNYYYYMASQFALSDRWFSPVASKTIDNRIATFTGGTTQGLVKDPGGDDHLSQLAIPTIFQELDAAGVTWKIYYTVTEGFCLEEDDCPGGGNNAYPATNFSALSYSYKYLLGNKTGTCPAPTVPSTVVGDSTPSFCIDPNHIAPISDPTYGYFADLKNGTLPSFAFIEAGYGNNDEHPGSGQSVLAGQAQVAKVIGALMATSGTTNDEWKDSVFFFAYDEGGGPYDHVPPVPGSSNINTNTTTLGVTPPDISTIAVNPDKYPPCLPVAGPPYTPTTNCDLTPGLPGAAVGDAPYVAPGVNPTGTPEGFGAQLGFRVPNMIVSPFTISHYVSHTPIDHTAIIKFVENRFIGPSEHLTARDAIMPNLLEFFNFTAPPWATPPTPPTPDSQTGTCNPGSMGP